MNTQSVQKTNDGNPARNLEKTRSRELSPPVDVYENEAELLIVADLPGATSERLDIKIDPPELRIATRPERDDEATWRRSFTIDERIDVSKVSAELKNGVLSVRLPKADEVRPRKVAIRGGA